jgi:four helix bundle protein
MVAVTHFRELRVWQRRMDLVERVYRVSEVFPKSELYGLTGQIRRAAVSIPSNVAEGHARESTKEYLNFVSMAQGPLAELETQLEIAVRFRYVSSTEAAPLFEEARALGKQLYALRNALNKRQ